MKPELLQVGEIKINFWVSEDVCLQVWTAVPPDTASPAK